MGTTDASRGRLLDLLKVHLALFLTQASFSTVTVFCKQAMETLSPMAVISLRVWAGVPCFLVFCMLWEQESLWESVGNKGYLKAGGLGLLSTFGAQVLFLYGLRLTSATNAACLYLAIPVWTTLIMLIWGGEKRSWKKFLGVFLTVCGALIIVEVEHFDLRADHLIGNLMILAMTVIYSVYMVLVGPIMASTKNLGPFTVSFWMFLAAGSAALIPLPFMYKDYLVVLTPGTLSGLFLAMFFGTVVSYALNNWALKRASSVLAAAYGPVEVLCVIVLAAIFLNQHITLRQVAGALAILVGLSIVIYEKHLEDKAEEASSPLPTASSDDPTAVELMTVEDGGGSLVPLEFEDDDPKPNDEIKTGAPSTSNDEIN